MHHNCAVLLCVIYVTLLPACVCVRLCARPVRVYMHCQPSLRQTKSIKYIDRFIIAFLEWCQWCVGVCVCVVGVCVRVSETPLCMRIFFSFSVCALRVQRVATHTRTHHTSYSIQSALWPIFKSVGSCCCIDSVRLFNFPVNFSSILYFPIITSLHTTSINKQIQQSNKSNDFLVFVWNEIFTFNQSIHLIKKNFFTPIFIRKYLQRTRKFFRFLNILKGERAYHQNKKWTKTRVHVD